MTLFYVRKEIRLVYVPSFSCVVLNYCLGFSTKLIIQDQNDSAINLLQIDLHLSLSFF